MGRGERERLRGMESGVVAYTRTTRLPVGRRETAAESDRETGFFYTRI
jgi:hypothetical protein